MPQRQTVNLKPGPGLPDLPAILRARDYPLRDLGGGNFLIVSKPGLIIKDSYWRWPEHDMQGNSIDLFVNVLHMSFAEAMDIISEHVGTNSSAALSRP